MHTTATFDDDAGAVIAALQQSQAIIEFSMDGTILTANQNYLDAMGYTLAEIKGRHHSLFLMPGEELTQEYRSFWDALRRGEFHASEYRRLAKGGRDVWIQATYNPVLGPDGRPRKVVKLAADVTALKLQMIENTSKIEAIGKSQAVIEFNMDGVILAANANYLDAVGYASEEIVGRHHSMFLEPGARDTGAYRAFWDTLRAGRFHAAEFRRIGKGGRIVWIQATYTPILDIRGKPVKVVKFATDITGEVKRREQIRMLSLVADATSNSAVITDVDGRTEYVNAGFTKMTGYSFEEARGLKPGHLLQGPASSEATRQSIREKLAARQPFFGEIVNYTRSGEPYWITLFINPVTNEAGEVNRFVSIQTDVTERKTSEARIAYLATHDPLTGLANRVLFQERLSRAREAGLPFAVLCLDLDRFKQVNDSLGHAGGDKLLRQVADRLGDCVRSTDTVARLGGDEFAVIHEMVETYAAVEAMARRIIERINAPFDVDGHHVSIGVSIGIALSEDSGADTELMLQQADRALYCAKGAGRGTFRAERCIDLQRSQPRALSV